MPRLVYRLEDATGAGPYAGDQVCSKFLQPHTDPDRLLAMFGYPNEVLSMGVVRFYSDQLFDVMVRLTPLERWAVVTDRHSH
jgi:hypothetical protein